ncbi:MAG: SPOR domain-containing protein [Chromatiaceae bacterium]|jgi:DedD protein|nr:SPOR domain-containing protein [Chromatiaceae bacterium]
MEEGAKRRLVGAAVFVALLVIFLPMLVEEREESPVPEAALVVPPRPAIEPRPQPAPPTGLTEEEERIEAPVGTAELAPPPLYIPPTDDESSPVEEESWIPVPIVAPQTEPKAPLAETKTPAPPSAQPAAPRPKPGAPSGWVVQVAALTEQPRAEALERELRAKGLPAFIETVSIDSKTFHRVRVGPESDRRRAEAMAASLKQQGHQAQILRYP